MTLSDYFEGFEKKTEPQKLSLLREALGQGMDDFRMALYECIGGGGNVEEKNIKLNLCRKIALDLFGEWEQSIPIEVPGWSPLLLILLAGARDQVETHYREAVGLLDPKPAPKGAYTPQPPAQGVEAISSPQQNTELVEALKNIVRQNQTTQSPQPQPPAQGEAAVPDSVSAIDSHYLMTRLKTESPLAYNAMKKGLGAGLIEFENGCFNFKCAIGTVGLIFGEAGFAEHKTLVRFIKINGDDSKLSAFKNWNKNASPAEWVEVKKTLFSE